MGIEPLDGLTVLVAGVAHDPDDHLGALAGGVGDDRAEMIVVGVLELVLDDYLGACGRVSGVDVRAEGADGRLDLAKLEVHPHGLAKQRQAALLGEPLGEVQRLVGPDGLEVDLL